MKARMKVQRRCGICGEYGHRSPTCSKRDTALESYRQYEDGNKLLAVAEEREKKAVEAIGRILMAEVPRQRWAQALIRSLAHLQKGEAQAEREALTRALIEIVH